MEILVEGKKYIIKKPNYKDLTNAQIHAGQVFNQAREGHCILRDNLQEYSREQGLWNDDKEAELLSITLGINHIITELKKGKTGEYKTMSQARRAALEVRSLRIDQLRLIHEQKKLDAFTAEAQAENARFDYLVSACILNEDNSKAFSSLDDYMEKSGEEWARRCAEELTYFLYPNVDRNWEDKFPENRFLKKNKFVDEKGRLVNKDGKLVDENFRLINDQGQWINEDGKIVNSKGEKIDEDGDVISSYEEFDDDIS